MHTGEVNAVAPLASPEESPATSYAVVFLRSPACVAVARVPFVSRCRRSGSQPRPRRSGLRRSGLRWRRLRMRCGPPDLFGPAQQVELGFQIHFCFILFT